MWWKYWFYMFVYYQVLSGIVLSIIMSYSYWWNWFDTVTHATQKVNYVRIIRTSYSNRALLFISLQKTVTKTFYRLDLLPKVAILQQHAMLKYMFIFKLALVLINKQGLVSMRLLVNPFKTWPILLILCINHSYETGKDISILPAR